MSVDSVDALITQLVAIEAALPPGDGVACFNRMYRLVTQSVQQSANRRLVVAGSRRMARPPPNIAGDRCWPTC